MTTVTYATKEINDFMNLAENFPQYSEQAQAFIQNIHKKYAPSNIYDPKTFDHLKELEVRKLFAQKPQIETQRKAFQTDKTVKWDDILS